MCRYVSCSLHHYLTISPEFQKKPRLQLGFSLGSHPCTDAIDEVEDQKSFNTALIFGKLALSTSQLSYVHQTAKTLSIVFNEEIILVGADMGKVCLRRINAASKIQDNFVQGSCSKPFIHVRAEAQGCWKTPEAV